MAASSSQSPFTSFEKPAAPPPAAGFFVSGHCSAGLRTFRVFTQDRHSQIGQGRIYSSASSMILVDGIFFGIVRSEHPFKSLNRLMFIVAD